MPSIERLLYLRRFPVIAGLPAQDMAVVAEYTRERAFLPGELLLRAGEPVGAIYLLIEGAVEVRRQGRWLGRARPGAGVGGLSLLARDPEGVEAKAVEETLALELEADALFEIFEDHFALLHHLLRDVCRDLVSLWARRATIWPVAGKVTVPEVRRELDLVERILLLRSAQVFRNASINALAEMARGLTEMRFDAGTTLWQPGDASGGLHLLVAGTVEVRCPERPLYQAGPGTPLGGLEALAELPRWYHATTATPVVTLHASVEGLHDAFEDNFEMAMAYLSEMARWLMTALEQQRRNDPAPPDVYGS